MDPDETPSRPSLPLLILSHLAALAALLGAWRFGILDGILAGLASPPEAMMLGALGCYWLFGLVRACQGHIQQASHVANSLPIWALAETGLGILLAFAAIHSLEPAVLLGALRAAVLAITPNILGVMGMAWIREVVFWTTRESI